VINLDDRLALFDAHWTPRVVATLNGYEVKVARLPHRYGFAVPCPERRMGVSRRITEC